MNVGLDLPHEYCSLISTVVYKTIELSHEKISTERYRLGGKILQLLVNTDYVIDNIPIKRNG